MESITKGKEKDGRKKEWDGNNEEWFWDCAFLLQMRAVVHERSMW